MAPAVRLREAVALSGRFPLLSGASLEIEEGQVVHIRGANGAGKTSLLRLLCGLLPLHSGEAVVLGHDLAADSRSVRRHVGMLGHDSHLYDELTVEENLHYFLRAAGGETARSRPAADMLGLSPRVVETPVGKLSAGQRRRATLALLVARDPRMWLLDEPHAGLDAEGRAILDSLIAGSRERGRTVLLCSHEQELARAVSDRVVLLAGGRVVKEPVGVA